MKTIKTAIAFIKRHNVHTAATECRLCNPFRASDLANNPITRRMREAHSKEKNG